jgi:hypothetical protein
MLSNWLKRFDLSLFFLLSLSISWAVWVPLAASKMGNPGAAAASGNPVNVLAVWAPGLSAMILSLFFEGKTGLRSLLRPIRFRRVGAFWHLVVFGKKLLPGAEGLGGIAL